MPPIGPDGRRENLDIPTAVEAQARVVSLDGRRQDEITRAIANETPVQILFADVPFAVMMLTPADLVDFAYGFSLTEGIISNASDIRDVEIKRDSEGIKLHIGLSGEKLHKHFARQRAMTGRTGCGVCGIDDINALTRAHALTGTSPTFDVESIARALAAFDAGQALNSSTRAVHGAAFASLEGEILAVREDVGRHNALDKLIGSQIRQQKAPQEGFIVISSRCSFEMVEKAAAFGARLLVAISAPTSLALRRAAELDLTLIGIARRDTMTVFTNADRLVTKDGDQT